MRISQYLLPNNYSHSLANLAEFYDLKNDNAHRAMSDVLTTSKIFTELLSLFMSINHITSPQTDMFTEEDFNNPKIRLLSDIELLYNKTTIN